MNKAVYIMAWMLFALVGTIVYSVVLSLIKVELVLLDYLIIWIVVMPISAIWIRWYARRKPNEVK